MNDSEGQVLVVDDDRPMCEFVCDYLRKEGFVATFRTSGSEALDAVGGEEFDVVLTDVNMRGIGGVELCGRLVQSRPEVPVIVCAERSAEDAEVRKHAREVYVKQAAITVGKTMDHADKVTKFDAYADFAEPIGTIPSHRYLAIRRGESEGVLRVKLDLDKEPLVAFSERQAGLNKASPWAGEAFFAVRTRRLTRPRTSRGPASGRRRAKPLTP